MGRNSKGKKKLSWGLGKCLRKGLIFHPLLYNLLLVQWPLSLQNCESAAMQIKVIAIMHPQVEESCLHQIQKQSWAQHIHSACISYGFPQSPWSLHVKNWCKRLWLPVQILDIVRYEECFVFWQVFSSHLWLYKPQTQLAWSWAQPGHQSQDENYS